MDNPLRLPFSDTLHILLAFDAECKTTAQVKSDDYSKR